MHSFSQTKNSVQETHQTQSDGCPWCPASLKTLLSPIGTPSWWVRQVLQPALDPTVCLWCPVSCHPILWALLSWEARIAQSRLHLCYPYIRLHLRLVCISVHSNICYVLCNRMSHKCDFYKPSVCPFLPTCCSISHSDRKRWRPAASPVPWLPKIKTWTMDRPVLSFILFSVQWV